MRAEFRALLERIKHPADRELLVQMQAEDDATQMPYNEPGSLRGGVRGEYRRE
jgi:hypothetical protein